MMMVTEDCIWFKESHQGTEARIGDVHIASAIDNGSTSLYLSLFAL